ncbi:MAG TPA: flagellar hook assembly protein FlgD [Gammaproteobacteria bacterium]|nr:flagellar hook assembly protein FlgD [Gammaproteobacteria bacterium]
MSNPTTNPLQGLGLRTQQQLQSASGTGQKTLGQKDFLKLMLTQLKEQNPTKPLDANQMISQMAQFSQVSGLQNLQKSVGDLSSSLYSNQALQGANLVGHKVLAPTGTAQLATAGGSVSGAVDLPAAASNVTLKVYDQSGQLVRSIPMGDHAAGNVDFKWDGMTSKGQAAPAGTYMVTAQATYNGKEQAVDTMTASTVQSVTLDKSGALTLNLAGAGSVDFSKVRQIM